MEIEKEDIEEIGEAIEALGKMVEAELQEMNLRLKKLENLISEPVVVEEEEEAEERPKILRPDFWELKKDTNEIREFLESFDVRLARVEQKAVELLREFQEQDISSMKNDLFLIRKDLEFIRNDTKELLDKKEELDEKIEHLKQKLKRSEGE